MRYIPTTALVIASALAAVAADQAPPKGPHAFRKILFLGNSITRHAPKQDIGWSGNWGMAASSEDKDYVHLVTRGLTQKGGPDPETLVKNIAAFEREYTTYDAAAQLEDAAAFNADLIILAIGENAAAPTDAASKAQFGQAVVKLLHAITANRKPTIVVRSCFWANPAKDEALKMACQEVGGTFVDIGALAKDEANYARAERDFSHKGVAAHPGDTGMRAIANAILEGIANRKQRKDER